MEINVHELSDKQLDELALKIRKGIQKDRENEKKQFKKRAFHNTRLLMREYHKLKAHNEVVKEHIAEVQGTFWEHRWLNLDILMQNKARTVKLMRHVDIALDVYKSICLSNDKNEERRKWRVLNKKYIEFPIMSEEKLAELLNVDRSTINRANKEALEDLSVILFGVDMINEW